MSKDKHSFVIVFFFITLSIYTIFFCSCILCDRKTSSDSSLRWSSATHQVFRNLKYFYYSNCIKNWKQNRIRIAYPHEVILWVKHASVHGGVVVVEGDHVKTDSLRYCQDQRQYPNGHNLDDGEERDAHSLHSAPGCHCPVPVWQVWQRYTWRTGTILLIQMKNIIEQKFVIPHPESLFLKPKIRPPRSPLWPPLISHGPRAIRLFQGVVSSWGEKPALPFGWFYPGTRGKSLTTRHLLTCRTSRPGYLGGGWGGLRVNRTMLGTSLQEEIPNTVGGWCFSDGLGRSWMNLPK